MTMTLDLDLRQMATDLQDTKQLARISGVDLVAIEAKYNFNSINEIKILQAKHLSNCYPIYRSWYFYFQTV